MLKNQAGILARHYSSHITPMTAAVEAHQKLSRKKSPTLLSPKKLKTFLDKYIVGQDTGKKVLSVAVYNHYLRINDKQYRLDQKKQLELVEEEFQKKEAVSVDHNYSVNNESMAGLMNLRRQLQSARDDDDLELSKSNILVVGPTGSGKTLLASTLARILDVPIAITDCTQLTQAGYIGDDVEKCIERLLVHADFDVSKAEKGIIVLDEIDKLAKASDNLTSKDVSGEGVQQSLLKIIEGHKVEVIAKRPIKSEKDDKNNKATAKMEETFIIDTSNILFMIMGAFVGLDKHISRRIASMRNQKQTNDSKGSTIEEVDEDSNPVLSNKNSLDEITLDNGKIVPALNLTTPTDLVSFGLIPELVGRVPIITALEPLQMNDLFHILKEPKNALLNQYEYIFKQFGVQLVVTEKALKKVAYFALKEGTGARGLRGTMERLLLNVNYESPDSDVAYVLINEDTVNSLQQTEYSLATEVDAKFYKKGQIESLIDDIKDEDTKLANELKGRLAKEQKKV